jgi:hypothetical protein
LPPATPMLVGDDAGAEVPLPSLEVLNGPLVVAATPAAAADVAVLLGADSLEGPAGSVV